MSNEPRPHLVYLDDYSDEVMPCAPKLEAWAEWLSKPDPTWNREAAAQDGQEFTASTLIELPDVRADWVDGRGVAAGPPPPGTDMFFLRFHEGSAGWTGEYGGDVTAAGFDLVNGLDCLDADESPVWLACLKNGGDCRVRYEAAKDGEAARCVIASWVQ